ncbi:trc8-like protein [Plakobranchus ocellatus]|uniref:Trc8-like protein n=1 Tax=Plakobranchus ocellatus TaxID=259542 RepID=A0AAV4BXW8_9GAST|nr:trc8-like protein [Plakobranchus ocellatus]
MSSIKKFLFVAARLPLLFLIDSIIDGTLLNFSSLSNKSGQQDKATHPLEAASDAFNSSNVTTFFVALFWLGVKSTVIAFSLVLVCSPISSLLEVYGCLVGFGFLYISYYCNVYIVQKMETSQSAASESNNQDVINYKYENMDLGKVTDEEGLPILIIFVTQLFIVLAFDQLYISAVVHKPTLIAKLARYPIDAIMLCSATLPFLLLSFTDVEQKIIYVSPLISALFPLALLIIHSIFVILNLIKIVQVGVVFMKAGVRELGIDGLFMQFMDRTNLSWLLQIFFFTKVTYLILASETLYGSNYWSSMSWLDITTALVSLTKEVLFTMCGTILCIMGLASIVSIISGLGLRLVYAIIGAHDDEEGIQPAVSGFLFVLLAMQTGITSINDSSRLMLLFQNCVLLFVANQHVVQTVAANLLLRASTDEVEFSKHVRPMLPYLVFFTFPFTVVASLWNYPFRMSWLLAISAFSLELMIKSITTLSIYTINMLHTHTNHLQENVDDLLFHIKAVCGCLEFVCGIFLLFNGAYIFFFESGGIIRCVMMIIHFYCNIYQTALKGWSTYKLRQSAWEKVNKLQPASQEQLDENDDICPICYQEMTEAVVIKCAHVFHKGCLQKWLSIQEKCPLCHVDLTEDDSQSANSNNNVDHPVQ